MIAFRSPPAVLGTPNCLLKIYFLQSISLNFLLIAPYLRSVLY